jgi:hypothetical protein
MCIPLGLHPIGVNLSFDFVANGHEMRRETHLSRRDSLIVAWHEVPGNWEKTKPSQRDGRKGRSGSRLGHSPQRSPC